MKHLIGSAALLGALALFGITQAGEKDAKGANTVRYAATAQELAKEFALEPEKTIKKYQPKKPFKAAVTIRGNVLRAEGQDLYLATDSQVLVVLRAKKRDGKVDGPTAALATDARFAGFRMNSALFDADDVKLTPIKPR